MNYNDIGSEANTDASDSDAYEGSLNAKFADSLACGSTEAEALVDVANYLMRVTREGNSTFITTAVNELSA